MTPRCQIYTVFLYLRRMEFGSRIMDPKMVSELPESGWLAYRSGQE